MKKKDVFFFEPWFFLHAKFFLFSLMDFSRIFNYFFYFLFLITTTSKKIKDGKRKEMGKCFFHISLFYMMRTSERETHQNAAVPPPHSFTTGTS
jgi:hypothetical protein